MNKLKNISIIGALAVGLSSIAISCSSDDPIMETPQQKSLYEKLGGTAKVTDPNDNTKMIEKGRLAYRSVVDSTITLIVGDIVAGNQGNFGQHFAPLLAEVGQGNTTNLAALSKNLTDFFSTNTGGQATNTYSGMNMANAHNPAVNNRMGKKATNADYNKFVGFVVQGAAKNGVTDVAIVNELGAVLESLRVPIVQQ